MAPRRVQVEDRCPAAGRPAPEDANMEAAESSAAQPTSSVIRTLEVEDDGSAKRQRLTAGVPILHETDADVNMDAHKLVVVAAMPDDQGQWTQRVIDWDKKYYGAKSGNLLDEAGGGGTHPAARSQSSESGKCLREVVGRRERDARGPKSGQEQIGCNTGEHVRPRGCDAGDTTNQSVQNHCESSRNENKCEGTARLFDCPDTTFEWRSSMRRGAGES